MTNSWLICHCVWIYDIFIKVNTIQKFFCGTGGAILNLIEVLIIQNNSMHIHQKVVEHVLLFQCHFNIGLSDNMIYLELPDLGSWPASIATKYFVSFEKFWSLKSLVFSFHIYRVKELDPTNSFFPFLLKLHYMTF